MARNFIRASVFVSVGRLPWADRAGRRLTFCKRAMPPMSDFETVKQRADIVDVIGGYASLLKAGRYLKACCPFHPEKTPSFYVYPDQQRWHCYGACATGGDVFTFLEKKENLTPVEAMRLLAERYGVTLERRGGGEHEPATNRLIEANEAAAQYYHALLLRDEQGAAARAYLGRRGVDSAMTEAFQLGASIDGWDHLRGYLAARGFTDQEMVAAGLLTENDGRVYDRFRGRLMFPIRDDRGRTVGFGGRVLGDGVPKYLNSPQTALFDKGGLLYGLDRAKDVIRAAGTATVVEGYMDVIAAHQHGITGVVATLGTALTERHINLLKRHARQVVLAMDADAAGIEAALRGEELVRHTAQPEGEAQTEVVVDWRNLVRVQAAAPVEVRVFTVPQGKDPDEAIRADPEAFRELTRRAVPPFEFRLQHELSRIDRENPRERLALADRLLPLVAGVADRTIQAQYLARLAQATAIAEDLLAARLRARPEEASAQPAPLTMRERTARPAAAGGSGPAQPPASAGRGPAAATKPELTCLRLLLSYPGLREAGIALPEESFTDPENRALFIAWRQGGTTGIEQQTDELLRARHSRVLAERIPPFDDAAALRALTDLTARLWLRTLADRSRLLASAVREAGAPAGSTELAATALAAFTGEQPTAGGDAGEFVQRLLQGAALAQDRHSLEMELRTHRHKA